MISGRMVSESEKAGDALGSAALRSSSAAQKWACGEGIGFGPSFKCYRGCLTARWSDVKLYSASEMSKRC